jgi:FkbM family methyltransferase
MAPPRDAAANITKIDELLARSMVTKIADIEANKIGVPRVKRSMRMLDGGVAAYNYKGKEVYFKCGEQHGLNETSAMVYENFERGQYRDLDVEGKVVVDIGANIGDTAIYFAMNGASQVYAFEPYPYTYKKALENIKLNGLEERITLLNEAVGPEEGEIRLDAGIASGGTSLKEFEAGEPIKISTISQVIKRFAIKSAQLKMDCEGYEYGILLNAQNEDLLHFDQMAIEYHYGYMDLKRRLESVGFKTTHSMPRVVFYDAKMRIGMILANRKP